MLFHRFLTLPGVFPDSGTQGAASIRSSSWEVHVASFVNEAGWDRALRIVVAVVLPGAIARRLTGAGAPAAAR